MTRHTFHTAFSFTVPSHYGRPVSIGLVYDIQAVPLLNGGVALIMPIRPLRSAFRVVTSAIHGYPIVRV